MAKITESLGASIKEKVFGVVKSKASSRESPDALLKVIGKNFMAMSAMARDMNVASQNIKELVRVMGGKPSDKEDKVAGSGLTADERERKLAVELEKDKQKEEPKKPSLVSKLGKKALDKFKSTKVGQKVTDKFAELKKAFNPGKIFKALSKYLVIGALIGVIFVAFKDSFVEWATGLFDAIKTKFDEFTDSIKQWFQDTIQPIIEKAKELIQPVIDAVSGFITKIGDWFKEKIGWFAETFPQTFEFIKKVIDKISGVIDGIKETLTGWAEKLLSNKATAWMVPDFVKNMIKKPAVLEAGETDAETKKLQRQQAQVLEQQETERVKKLEKEKQYTGDDEIVRARLGLPPKTESMRQEEESKKQAQPVEVAPPPESILVPGPMPTPAAPKGKAAAPVPKEAPKPISAEPPTAVGKAAEKPKSAVGSLTSVAAVQPGVDLSFSPQLEERVSAMAADFKEKTGKKLLITSGFRSNEKQKQLYDDWKAGKLKAPAVAQPMPPLGKGKGSAHMFGTALDINSKGPAGINTLAGSIGSPTGWLESFGLTRPIKGEDWHVQLPKTPPTADNPFSPGSPIPVPTKDGKAVDVASGKKETVLPNPPSSKSTGSQVAASSTEVAAGQRQQAKPSTPIIVNAPTTNNQVIQNNTVAAKKSSVDANKQLMSRAA